MNTQTLVRGSADIVTVTTLARNDVYKRLEENTYGEKYILKFGVVTDVMHNGEDAVITALEFTTEYNGATSALKVFGTDSDLKLFAATPTEFIEHKADVQKRAERAVADAQTVLEEKRRLLAVIESTFTNDVLARLTIADTTAAITS